MFAKRLVLFLTCCLAVACNHPPETKLPIAARAVQSEYDLALIKKLSSLDIPLDAPKSGEWLAIHKEKGQTFAQYKSIGPVKTTGARKTIYILPIGDFKPYEDSLVHFTSIYLQAFFGLRTIIAEPLKDLIVISDGRRNSFGDTQLRTSTIIAYLKKNIPDDAIVFMAITATDLYDGGYNYLFGQAHTRDRVGVSSMFRFLDKPVNKHNYRTSLERIIKTASHEIAHMFSCQHCTHAICVMNGSNSLSESDSRPNRLCSECLQKLQWNLHFDIAERCENLNAFFRKHDLVTDGYWLLREQKLMEGTN